MALRFLGAVVITPATPKLLSTVFPTEKGKPCQSIIIAQRRGNTGFFYVGSVAMTGETTASYTVPPASASQVPMAVIEMSGGVGANPLTIDAYAIDGSAADTVQVSVEEC